MERLITTLSKTGSISSSIKSLLEGRDRLLRLFQYITRYMRWHWREIIKDKVNENRYHGISGKYRNPSLNCIHRVHEVDTQIFEATRFFADILGVFKDQSRSRR